MNIRFVACLAGFSLVAVHAADTGIEFAGVMTAGGKTRIAVTDSSSKSTTWIEPGQEFKGYRIERYDAEEEAIYVTKAGERSRIGMVAARTPEEPAVQPASSEQVATAIRSNLLQLAAAARQYQIQHGVQSVSYTDLVGPGKLIKELKPVAGESYSTLTFGQNVTGVSVTTAGGSTVSVDLSPVATAGTSAAGNTTQANQSAFAASEPAGAPTGRTPSAPSFVTITRSTTPPEQLPPPEHTAAPQSHTIKSGETWEGISMTTGVPVSRLQSLNPGIGKDAPLPAGKAIRIR